LCVINPFRYRSYYYDTETWFYYLQSRYYDPAIGRFLNADALVSTGQGLLGNNMFAYCNNNPAIYADPEGNLPGGIINPNAMARNSGGSLHPISDKDQAKQRINTNENAVLKAEQYAYYKGVLYLKVPGDSAFSFGIVFFGSEIDDANLVRHEYGHTRQLAKLGNSDYLRYVVLPSVTCFWLTEWDKIPSSIYHYLPWEYIANRYGGIPGYNSGKYDMIANTYWDNVRILSFVS
jgi:RHS repeat-associated protein